MQRTWSKLADLSRALLLATHRAVCLGLCAEVNLYRRQACFGVRGWVSRVSPLQELYEAFIDCRIINVETSPIFWQMSNNYNFSLFMLGDKGVSILNIEY